MPIIDKDEHLILFLHVHPASKKDEWCGLYGSPPQESRSPQQNRQTQQGRQALKVKIKAPPVDGKANEHLIQWLAREFQVKQSAVTLLKGHQSPNKQVKIISPTCIPEPIAALALLLR